MLTLHHRNDSEDFLNLGRIYSTSGKDLDNSLRIEKQERNTSPEDQYFSHHDTEDELYSIIMDKNSIPERCSTIYMTNKPSNIISAETGRSLAQSQEFCEAQERETPPEDQYLTEQYDQSSDGDKLYHGTRHAGLLKCEDLRESNDGLLHLHTYPATTTSFSENVVVCDSDLNVDELHELPDLLGWQPDRIANEFEKIGIISTDERDAVLRFGRDIEQNYSERLKEHMQARDTLFDILQNKNILAFKYKNKYENIYKDDFSVAVIDKSTLSNPVSPIYPGQGRDALIKNATATGERFDPKPPFKYSEYVYGDDAQPEDQYFTEQNSPESYKALQKIHPVFLDEQGNPKIIYHGSPNVVFNPEQIINQRTRKVMSASEGPYSYELGINTAPEDQYLMVNMHGAYERDDNSRNRLEEYDNMPMFDTGIQNISKPSQHLQQNNMKTPIIFSRHDNLPLNKKQSLRLSNRMYRNTPYSPINDKSYAGNNRLFISQRNHRNDNYNEELFANNSNYIKKPDKNDLLVRQGIMARVLGKV